MSYSSVILNDNPLAYYRLGESVGSTTLYDASGNGNTGTVSGSGVTFEVNGALASDDDTAATFDGTAGKITLPLITSAIASVSLECWVYLPDALANGVALKMGNASTGWGFGFGGTTVGNAGSTLISFTEGYTWYTSGASLSLNAWHHIVVTLDSAGTTLSAYVDGILARNDTITAPTAPASSSSIGVDASSLYFHGTLDEVAIYGTTLGETQIQAHYQSGATSLSSNVATVYSNVILQDSPLAYYRLDDLSLTVLDWSGNANNGTISNSGVLLAQPGAISSDTDTAILFDGAGVGSVTLPALTTAIAGVSLECWVNLPNALAGGSAIKIGSSLSAGYGFGFGGTSYGTAGSTLLGLAEGDAYFSSGITVSVGVWHHIAMVIDTPGLNFVFYVDGALVATIPVTGVIAPSGAAYIGIDAGAHSLHATIDEVAIYGTALNAARVQAHYQAAQLTPGAYSVLSNGVELNVLAGSLTGSLAVGRNAQASFTAHTPTDTHFYQYQQVQVYDQNNSLAYNGYIVNPKETKRGFYPSLVHTITCTDQTFLAQKRVVSASYINKLVSFMVNDIYTNILAAEGVTIGLIATTTVTVPTATFTYCTVAAALDALVKTASSEGVPYYWMIDANKALWFVPYTSVVNSTLVDGSQIEMTRSPTTVVRANPTYRNSQYITAGTAQTVTQTETRAGDGNITAWSMSFALSTVPTVSTKIGAGSYTTKTVGISGLDTGKDFYWNKGSPVISQDSAGTKLTSADLLKVVYVGEYPNITQSSDAAAISAQALIDGTSGIIDAVQEDATITTVSGGLFEASYLLTRYAVPGVQLVFSTMQAGFAQGQLITVNLPDYGLYSEQMLIENVAFADSDGIQIWYTVTAIQGPSDVNWTSFFARALKQKTPADAINVGSSTSTPILQQFNESFTLTSTFTATVHACPVPSTSLFPSTVLYPC